MIKISHIKPNIRMLCMMGILILCNMPVYSQIVFWTEAFQNGCSSGCLANTYTGPNGAWTLTTLYPNEGCGIAATPNVWYISGAECGRAAGLCGTTCGTTDPSLHIGSTSMGDMGASYDAGGWCPFLGDPGSQTDTRCESPVISCVGFASITVSFNYIENGDGSIDNATFWYYNGTTWAQIADMPKTPWGSCSPQGQWTAYTIALPASANNNANVRIAFKWVNADDYNGTDPSFAVDDIVLRYVTPLPISLLSFEGHRENNHVILNWETASETNNDYFEIQRSLDGFSFSTIGFIDGSGNSNSILSYSYTDLNNFNNITYYRLKQVDFDGAFSFSKVIDVNSEESLADAFSLQTTIVQTTLTALISSTYENSCFLEIKDVLGKTLNCQTINLSKGNNTIQYNISTYTPGMYIVFLKDKNNKKVVTSSKFLKYQ